MLGGQNRQGGKLGDSYRRGLVEKTDPTDDKTVGWRRARPNKHCNKSTLFTQLCGKTNNTGTVIPSLSLAFQSPTFYVALAPQW